MRDPYEILQVSKNAEIEVIEAAYRRLARKYHPDTNPAPDANAKMQAINWAYEILSNPLKRRDYDRTSAASQQSSSPPGRPYTSAAPPRPSPPKQPPPSKPSSPPSSQASTAPPPTDNERSFLQRHRTAIAIGLIGFLLYLGLQNQGVNHSPDASESNQLESTAVTAR